MWATVAWAAGGALSLLFLYRHIQVNWPQSYFGPTETLAQYFSGSGVRYVLFRFLPPYVMFVLVGLYSPGEPGAAVWITAGVYATLSTTLSIRSSLSREEGSVQLSGPRIAVLVSIVLGIGLCALAATHSVPAIAPSAPPIADIAANLIAALIAVALAVSYFMGTLAPTGRPNELPEDLTHQIRMIALDNGADQQLAIAIAYVENLQRPAWFRRLERIGARVHRAGSFGLFQVKGHGPVDDVESCRIAMRSLRGAFPLLDEHGFPVDWSVRQCAERHNPDAKFADMVSDVYRHLPVYPIEATSLRAPDGRPLLEVSAVGRFGSKMAVRGTYWSTTETLAVDVYRLGTNVPTEITPTLAINDSGRSTWNASLASDITRLAVRSIASLDDCFTSEQIDIDLRRVEVSRDLTLR